MFSKFAVLSSIVLSLFFFLPQQAFANLIGTHLGEGDITAQVNIMDFVGSKLSNPDGYPVTILVYAGSTTRAELDLLAAAAQRNRFFPIVRIDRTCEDESPALAQSFVNEVRAAFSFFGDNMAIAWGNEVNNQEIECPKQSNYFSGHRVVKGQVAPSAIDYYNSVFPAQEFLSRYNLYDQAPYFTANAYGCMGEGENTAETCNIAETSSHEIGFQDQASRGKFFITEFGLSPGNGQPNNGAADTNLRNVVDFIETRAAGTGAEKVTALMRNVCGGGSRWLILISRASSVSGTSEVYTASGAKVNIDTCSGIDATGDYYLYPIPGFYEQEDPAAMQAAIIDDLNKQGYQAQCLLPQNVISASIPGSNAPSRVIQRISANEILEAVAEVGIDLRSSKIPGWRLDGDHELETINSIETLFGFRKTSEDDPAANFNSFEYAPIYRSLTLHQQCFQQSKILDTIRNKCYKLASPDTCSLNKPIENSTYDIFGLQQEMNVEINAFLGQANGDRDQARELACESIIQNSPPDSQLRRALAHTPLFISNSYRLGFLVLSVILEGERNEVSDRQPFRFLRETDGAEPNMEPKHEVRVFAFKIPDVGTNKDPDSDIYYKDPLDLLTDTIVTKQNQDKNAINYKLITTTENSYTSTEAVPVKCTFPQSRYCNMPGVQALVSYVNMFLRPQNLIKPPLISSELYTDEGIINEDSLKQAVTNPDFSECNLADEDMPIEALTRIFSSGQIADTVDLEFAAGNQYEAMIEQGVSQTSPGPEDEWPFSFLSFAKLRRDDAPVPAFNSDIIDVKGYLVLPQGYQIGHIEDAMLSKFHTKEQKDMFLEALNENPRDPKNEDNPFSKLVRYFGVEGIIDNITSSPGNRKLEYDFEDPANCVLPGTQQTAQQVLSPSLESGVEGESSGENAENQAASALPTCRLYDFYLELDKEPLELPRVHGGLFGEIFLATQKALYTHQSVGWKYIDSCENIEDFILGTCSGFDDREDRIPPNEAGPEFISVAQCIPGSARITSGERAQHVTVQNSSGDECMAFSTSNPDHFIAGWRNANELPRERISEYCQNTYSYAACTFPNALIQNRVNPSTGEWLNSNSTEGITACEYVAQKAYDAGVSPIFALAMWGEESGFSSYRDAYAMGVTSQPKLDLEAQTRVFLNTVTNQNYNSRSGAHPVSASPANAYLNFLEQYSAEPAGSNLFCRNPHFPARLKDFHNHLLSRR